MALALDGVLIGAVFSLFGLGLFAAGSRRFFWALSLYRNDAKSVREIAQSEGAVEFDGQVVAPSDSDAFEAPFSGEKAFLCQIWMEKLSRFSEGGETEIYFDEDHRNPADTEKQWGLADTDEIRQPFAVADGGARVVVDPDEADLDITGHMGAVVHSIEEGESLSEKIRDRLQTLEGTDPDFDAALETWDDEESAVKYREARLEPQETVHVTGAEVRSIPERWGSGIDARVGKSETDDRYMISRGTESAVVRRHFVQFVTGTILGLALLAVGGRALYLAVLA
ncbi:MAG: hypothetical protein ACI8TL_001732 [Natronomonas sp.]|jgi:hypothetical protein